MWRDITERPHEEKVAFYQGGDTDSHTHTPGVPPDLRLAPTSHEDTCRGPDSGWGGWGGQERGGGAVLTRHSRPARSRVPQLESGRGEGCREGVGRPRELLPWQSCSEWHLQGIQANTRSGNFPRNIAALPGRGLLSQQAPHFWSRLVKPHL